MTNWMYRLLSHSGSGLFVAGVVGLLGVLIVRLAPRLGHRWIRVIGAGVSAVAALLAVGGAVTMRRIQTAMAKFPPPGRMVDVGGYRMHILAEGDAKGGPTVIWIPGSHEAGLNLHHLHKAIRQETRSILFDRPGDRKSVV